MLGQLPYRVPKESGKNCLLTVSDPFTNGTSVAEKIIKEFTYKSMLLKHTIFDLKRIE